MTMENEPKVERVLGFFANRDCSPSHEELKRVLGALDQEEYNACGGEMSWDELQVIRRWLERAIEGTKADERECPFGVEEMGDFLDELRMGYPGWADDRAIDEAYKVAHREWMKHARPLPPAGSPEREKRTNEMAEFFDCFPANRGWRRDMEGRWYRMPTETDQDTDPPHEAPSDIVIHRAKLLSRAGSAATALCGNVPAGQRWGLSDFPKVVTCSECVRLMGAV